jgi:ABC-type multidrug transport system fused ATPase/permease subunit
MQTTDPSPSNQEIKDLLIRLFTKFEQFEAKVEQIESDIRQTNTKVEKWDGRLWALTLGLVGSAWAAIIAAAVVVVVRSIANL